MRGERDEGKEGRAIYLCYLLTIRQDEYRASYRTIDDWKDEYAGKKKNEMERHIEKVKIK